jgi:ribosomal protein S18 acetylase RimI-like enzyme
MPRGDDLVLRAPRASDRAAVEHITRSTGFFSDVEVRVALEVFDEAVADSDSGYEYLVAESQRAVLGYTCWGGPIEQTESSFDLYWIAVDESARGRGIGGRLLAAAEAGAAAAGCSQLIVETSGREQYAPTHAFYVGAGYQRVAELPDFYAPGDAKVFYIKRLDGACL